MLCLPSGIHAWNVSAAENLAPDDFILPLSTEGLGFLLLGSGLFSHRKACACGVKVALGTDVGAGASFFLPQMMGEAYKVGQLRGEALDPLHAFYMATLAGARALKADDRIGNLLPGKEADFLVLNLAATPLLARRMSGAATWPEKLFVLSLLADDRVVERTYLAGDLAHRRA